MVNIANGMRAGLGTGTRVSPVVVRTWFMDQFVNIQDLQSQLYRDMSHVGDLMLKDYIQELIDRLEKLKG